MPFSGLVLVQIASISDRIVTEMLFPVPGRSEVPAHQGLGGTQIGICLPHKLPRNRSGGTGSLLAISSRCDQCWCESPQIIEKLGKLRHHRSLPLRSRPPMTENHFEIIRHLFASPGQMSPVYNFEEVNL